MNQKETTGSNESDQQNYPIPALYQSRSTTATSNQNIRDDETDDNESNQNFFSEPSVSEGYDSSSRIIRPPHRVRPIGRQVHSSDDERGARAVITQQSPVPSSPGNTSLSSWESPATRERVLVQFPSEQESTPNKIPSQRQSNNNNNNRYTTPSAHQVNQSMQNSREQSQQALQESDTTSRDDSILHQNREGIGAIMRKSYSGGKSNNNDRQATQNKILRTAPSQADESIIMTLSDSSDGDAERSINGKRRTRSLDGETHHSADDEKTAKRLPTRIRSYLPSGKMIPGHRRTRSGDAAAATIATGGAEWVGMGRDKIPLPDTVDDDDGSGDFPKTNNVRKRAHRTARQEDNANGKFRLNINTSFPSMSSIQENSADQPKWSQPEYTNRRSDSQRFMTDQIKGKPSRPAFPNKETQYIDDRILESRFGTNSQVNRPTQHLSNSSVSDYSSTSDGEEADSPNVQHNRVQVPYQASLDDLEGLFESRNLRGTSQNVLRTSFVPSPFANIGSMSTSKVSRSAFLPQANVIDDDAAKCPTYICPRCKTRQREFFTASDAPRQLEGPSSYLAFYFAIYVVCSLFVFGLQEGWEPLDCIYFAVVTLTTCGLGDLVPTTDANKIICSIFIYFGVACIGLLLGSYIAGILDDKAARDAKQKQIDSCPNCARLQTLRDEAAKASQTVDVNPAVRTRNKAKTVRARSERNFNPRDHAALYQPRNHDHQNKHGHHTHSRPLDQSQTGIEFTTPSPPIDRQRYSSMSSMNSGKDDSTRSSSTPGSQRLYSVIEEAPSAESHSYSLGSPVTRQILGRQSHTRHESIDVGSKVFTGDNGQGKPGTASRVRKYSDDLSGLRTPAVINENSALIPPNSAPSGQYYGDANSESRSSDNDDESSVSSTESDTTAEELLDEATSRIKAAKYVFLTLRQALVNSIVIIAFGALGFWFIEGFSMIDSWYFTVVLTTTTGYGDITPVTKGGKLFATVYLLVGGTILLNNMSLISMIPLELRKRRIQRAVLTQFGDQLDDAALKELATGPLIQRLNLRANRLDGLDECTREMFSLAMLVRLGKVTEDDIRETFASFRRLDVNDDGVLNSRSIIMGMYKKRKAMGTRMPPPPPNLAPLPGHPQYEEYLDNTEESNRPRFTEAMQNYHFGPHGSLHVGTADHSYHFRSRNNQGVITDEDFDRPATISYPGSFSVEGNPPFRGQASARVIRESPF